MTARDDFKPGAEAQTAYAAFINVERVSLLLARKERELTVASVMLGREGSDEDRAWYFEQTEKMRAEWDAKREKARLP